LEQVTNLEVTLFDVDKLIPDPDNVRLHDDRNKDALIRSIKRFGIRKPIVAHKTTNIVYAGNLTLEVAIELDIKQIPVAWIPETIPESVCKAYAIADNKTSELGGWDTKQLEKVIADLKVLPDFEPTDTGFSLDELNDMFVIPTFEPVDKNEQPRLDQKKPVKCPNCGTEFVPDDR